ncbi:hypothetical protein F4779DRAFT_632330 [Xylariaceae sp. FL0662B]|nr:hypothetical protein F4779DRAFT_632330 [Xylariaceae sp. FL0662B]
MTGARDQGTRQPDDPQQDINLSMESGLEKRYCPNFPPEFWDSLPEIEISPRALRELDRRNSIKLPSKLTVPRESCTTDLIRFARHGGPDLRNLRGYPDPRQDRMGPKRRRGPFDTDEDTYNHEYPEGCQIPRPDNFDEIRRELLAPKPDLSPLLFSEQAFSRFTRRHRTAQGESSVMTHIIPLIAGDFDIHSECNQVLANYELLTDNLTVASQPNYFDGTGSNNIHKQVLADLDKVIVGKNTACPLACNFFLEVKGDALVAFAQATYDGAYGARAMHSLQNYGIETPFYDNMAYTISATYHTGTATLELYTHHITAPGAPGGKPAYHMFKLMGFNMTSDLDTFVRGASALQNARNLAKQHRGHFIKVANTRCEEEAGVTRVKE